jgi:hypothetical protein
MSRIIKKTKDRPRVQSSTVRTAPILILPALNQRTQNPIYRIRRKRFSVPTDWVIYTPSKLVVY